MSHKGFSHIGLSTLDMEKTQAFYEGVLGFRVVIDDMIKIAEGGSIRHVFFDIGRDQLLAFMESRGVSGIPKSYDAGINKGLGLPASFYHFAFEAGSLDTLAIKRDALRGKGIEVTDMVDHSFAQSIYFRDPNGISLEYCCFTRDLTEDDARMREFALPRAALEMTRATSAAVSKAQTQDARKVLTPVNA